VFNTVFVNLKHIKKNMVILGLKPT